jgi:uncharacterized protein (DUF2267 family)
VNAEYAHQLYGGEVSDHFMIQGKLAPDSTNTFFNNDQKLGDIYSDRVKQVGRVAVPNSPINFNLSDTIERQPDPLIAQLQDTLTKVAQEYGLTPDSTVNTNFKPALKDQSTTDIQQANDAVMKALEELKSLGAI